MNPKSTSWQRLVAAARQAPPVPGDEAAPYGFATRVAALAMAAEHPIHSLFSRRLWARALGVSCLIALGAVAANFSTIAAAFDDEPVVTAVAVGDDPVGEVLDMAS